MTTTTTTMMMMMMADNGSGSHEAGDLNSLRGHCFFLFLSHQQTQYQSHPRGATAALWDNTNPFETPTFPRAREWVRKRANEWVQQSAWAKQAGRSKGMSERCKQINEWVAQYLRLDSWSFGTIVGKWLISRNAFLRQQMHSGDLLTYLSPNCPSKDAVSCSWCYFVKTSPENRISKIVNLCD